MKWFFNPCGRHREDICLLASGAMAGPESDELKAHLATCGDCRKFYAEIKVVTVPLRNWERNLTHLEPTPAARQRWVREIQAAGRPKPVRRLTSAAAFREWWLDVVWSSCRVWAGLATVWVLILAGHVFLNEHPENRGAKFSPASQATIMAVKDRDSILAEILADHSVPRDADRPRFFLPKPRTQHLKVFIL